MATVKAITQETFDLVVDENINDFGMDINEALEDAMEQFTSQGVNLSMIIKAERVDGNHVVVNMLNTLETLCSDGKSPDSKCILSALTNLSREFKSDLAKRYQANKIINGHNILFKLLQLNKKNGELFIVFLKTYSFMIEGQPDLVTNNAFKFFVDLLEESNDSALCGILSRIIRQSCTKHEANRQFLVKLKGVEIILKTTEKFADCQFVIKEACGVLRALTLDDDVRVMFGKAHDHTKLIVAHDGMKRLFLAMKDHEKDIALCSDLCSTLCKLMVRNEFCQQLVDLGGLDIIINMMKTHQEYEVLMRQCISLIKAISGNDDVKISVVRSGAVELIIEIFTLHQEDAQVCLVCFGAISMLALRNPNHCDIIMSNKAAAIMTTTMEIHGNNAAVQKQACMAIRNLVSHRRQHSASFIESGAEKLIREARKRHNSVLEDESKAALRDLDVEVDLKERWLGKNPGIMS